MRFRGHGQRLGVGVEGRDHHVGHVHLLGPLGTKHTSASRLLPQFARLGSKLHKKIHIDLKKSDERLEEVRNVCKGAYLDLLLEQVDLVLLLYQLLLLLGNLRPEKEACVSLLSVSMLRSQREVGAA